MKTQRPTPLLNVSEISLSYAGRGKQLFEAVRQVSFDLLPGEILGLVGESGAGKSTVASAVLRLQPLTSGKISFRGKDIASARSADSRDLRRRIQAVFQDPYAALSPRRTVRQSLVEPLDHFRMGDRDRRDAMIAKTIESVGLDTTLLERLPNELSGGQRQRVALARALVCEPDLVVADEPVSSLDVPTQKRITDLILELRESLGIAFLFISHDIGVVRRLADSMAVMYAGRIVETGPTDRLLRHPAHPYTQALLQAVPVADPAQPAPRALDGEAPAVLTPASGCVFHTRCSEAFSACREREPAEVPVTDEHGTTSRHHRTRCHLWNP